MKVKLVRLRGGAWNNYASYARCACRYRNNPGFRYNDVGFRCCFSSSFVIKRKARKWNLKGFVGALGTTMPGTPVAHVATGTIPAAVTISSVFVVVFPILWFSGRFSPIQKGKPMNHEGQIYHSHGRALGDVLASTMLYLRWSQENEQPLKMSTWYFKGRKKEYSYKLHEILELFTPEQTAKLIITDEKPTMRHSSDEGIDQIFQRIKHKWHPSNVTSKIIAYQFDGKNHKEKNSRRKQF